MENEHELDCLIGKSGKLVMLNDFVLYGKILSITDAGVVFKTKQKTSFISFQEIRKLEECVLRD